MTQPLSIYERALGDDFKRLHPHMQRRFGLTADAGLASIGTGIMDRVWHGAAYTLPFLYVGTWRSIMFPEMGTNVPFTIENYAYLDPLGRDRHLDQNLRNGEEAPLRRLHDLE